MLVERARGGSIAAAKELLDRTLGKPTQEIIVEQQEQRSPDEVRGKLAALLMKHPELRGVLESAGEERAIEAMSPAERLQSDAQLKTPSKPEQYESD